VPNFGEIYALLSIEEDDEKHQELVGSKSHMIRTILLNNQRDAALSSCIYSSLQGYSTCFGCFLHPSSGVQLKLQMHHRCSSCVSVVWFKSVERCPRSGVYFAMS
jgi:hypothetical protein